MEDAKQKVCFTDDEVKAEFMDEFAPDGTDADADDELEYEFILFRIDQWRAAKLDWLIPGRARIIGIRPPKQKEVMLITHVIRFHIDLH